VEKGPMPEKSLEAFKILKTNLCSEPAMAFPRSDRTFLLKKKVD
jgi:hypothetical protein